LQELISQREQLENADRNLDNMNSTLDQSQKHINNIKSIFGGIKNWWVSKPASTDLPGSSSDSTDNLRAVVEKSTKVAGPAQPAFGPEGHSPYRSNSDFPASSQSNLGSSPLPNKNYDAVLDSNLDQMSLGLSRLKGLAEGLGGEIATQNNLLDSLNSKTERVDLKVGQQQTQMDRILGKKK
jgi:synaptosomal-associated protein 29